MADEETRKEKLRIRRKTIKNNAHHHSSIL